jgi:hypothetical protein
MILPRAWVPKPVSIDYGAIHVSELIDASKGDKLPWLPGLFYKQPKHKRSENGYKGANTRMVKKFVAGLLTTGKAIG